MLPASLAHLALALAAAALGTVLAYRLAARRGTAINTVDLLHDTEAQVLYPAPRARRSWLTRGRAQLRARLVAAGRDGWTTRLFLVLSGACGLGAAGAALVLLVAAPFVLVGLGLGLAAPWLWLGRQAEKTRRTLALQITHLLQVISGASAAGLPLQAILADVVPGAIQEPLAGLYGRARQRFDPAQTAELIADLDRRLANGAFHLAREAIEDHLAEGTSLTETVAIIAELAREDLTFASEVRANYALIRGTAAIIFVFPFLFTALFRLLDPRLLIDAYSTPLGWAVATLTLLCCLGSYQLATASERRTARESLAEEGAGYGSGEVSP